MAQLVFISRNTRKLFHRSWKEVEKFRFVQCGSGLFLLHFQTDDSRTNLISKKGGAEWLEFLYFLVGRCGTELFASVFSVWMFLISDNVHHYHRFVYQADSPCPRVPQASFTASEKSFLKSKCEYQGVLEREAFLLTVHFPVPFLAAQCCSQRPAVCVVLGASSPLDGAGSTAGSRAGTEPSYRTQG